MIMSSNNAILIKEHRNVHGSFEYDIYDICVDTYPDQEGFSLESSILDIRTAIKFAQEQYSEYGIHFEFCE
jgi:hypothetical protein